MYDIYQQSALGVKKCKVNNTTVEMHIYIFSKKANLLYRRFAFIMAEINNLKVQTYVAFFKSFR